MKVFSVFLTLCTIMALSHAYPHNFTYPSDPYPTTSHHAEGICEYKRRHCTGLIGEFCPQCDADGNFLPQQCWPSTGHCWCVDIYTGEEIPNTNTPPGVTPVNCGHSGGDDYYYCPHGWSSFRDKCFMFIDTPKKWIEAEVYCQFDDANLVSIHDEEENRFIMSLTRGHTHNFPETWTGGFDAIHPGYWMWSDGSDFTYNNWYESPYNNNHDDDDDDNDHKDEHEHHDDNDDDEHDNDHKDEHEHHGDNDSDDDKKDQEAKKKNCLRINYEYDLKWFYASCTDSLPFVCSKKAY